MPKVIVQTDDGDTVWTLDYPESLVYAIDRMPSCPSNTAVHGLLMGLKRALQDAPVLQRGGDPRRLSERVMDRLAEEK